MTETEIERWKIHQWLMCEAFEMRFDPSTSELIKRLAIAVQKGVDPHISLAEMETEYESDTPATEQVAL